MKLRINKRFAIILLVLSIPYLVIPYFAVAIKGNYNILLWSSEEFECFFTIIIFSMIIQLLISFVMGLLIFNVNHRIKKFTDIKIWINTLFHLYAQEDSLQSNDAIEVNKVLMNEILYIEKLHDGNNIIAEQVDKLRELRRAYYKYTLNSNEEEFKSRIEKINFKKLNKLFIILSILS